MARGSSGIPAFANLNMKAIMALFNRNGGTAYNSGGADKPFGARDLLFRYGRDKPLGAPGTMSDGVFRGGPVTMDPLTSQLFTTAMAGGKNNLSDTIKGLAQGSGGSQTRTGMGLSDFGKPFSPNSSAASGGSAAPNVVGASKHPGPNLNALARAAITSQYGPVLGAIASAIGQTRGQAASDRSFTQRQGNRAEGDLATLYGRLGLYARNTQRTQDQDYHRGVQQTRHNFNALQGQTANDLRVSGGGIARDLQRMGVDPSIALAGASKDAAFTRSMAREDSANQISNTRASRREYDAGMGRMRNDIIASGNAAVGTQKSQTSAALNDIARQLSSNIMQLQMQRAQTLGQQAGALGQLRLTQAQAKQAAKDPMAHLNLLVKQAQLAKTLHDLNNPSSSSATAKGPGKGMAAALQYLQSVYPTTEANWSTEKRAGLSQMLEQLYTDTSASKPKGGTGITGGTGGVAWDKNTGGDLINLLLKRMAGVKGPKGNPMYGNPTDQNAARNALMIALGAM